MVRMEHASEQHGVSGYAFASVSDITDLVADNEEYRREGELPERVFHVWRLTDAGPVPAAVSTRGHRSAGLVEVAIMWREAIGGGTYGQVGESGFYRMSEV